jgi:hypothetical protein
LGKRRKRELLEYQIGPGQDSNLVDTGSGSGINQAEAGPGIESLSTGEEKRAASKKKREVKKQPKLWKKKAAPELVITRTCSNCGKTSSADAAFCQYCGNPFEI